VVSLPPSLAGDTDPTFSAQENKVDVTDLSATRLVAQSSATRVVLVIDTSGSMQGKPLADAKAAATRFVSVLGEGSQIAIIAFADESRTASEFTDDPEVLERAIASLEADGETALYDALADAGELASSVLSPSRTSVVVLSDGGDTASDRNLGAARATLERLQAPVYAVALKSDEYNPSALDLLTESTGGRLVPAGDSQQLTELFEGIAEEISSAWSITYTSQHPRTADIEVDIVAHVADLSASSATAYKNPSLAAISSSPVEFPSVSDNLPLLWATALTAMLAVALLVTGVLLITVRDRNTLHQVHFYDQLHESMSQSASAVGPSGIHGAIVDAVGVVAGKRGLTQLATRRLEAAGLPLRSSEYMTMHILMVAGLGVLSQSLTGSFALSILLIGLATIGPLIAIEIASDRRRRRFSEQLPDVLSMIASSLRGGWGIQQAIGLAAQEVASPTGPELKRVETETRLGMSLERSLQSMADRMESPDFHAVVGAIAVQREVGGNLAEVLDLVAKTVRERDAMRRQIKALTAEGRLSAWILIVLPFAVLALLLVTSPSYLVPMFTTLEGIALLTGGVVLLAIGSIWMYRVTKIEV